MTKTLEELAQSNISQLRVSTGSVFDPNETASKVLGVLKDTNRTEAVAALGGKYGIITLRDLLGVDQPERTKIENIWKQVGYISPNTSVLEAVDIMIKNNVTAIPLVTKDEIGLLSQQDITAGLVDIGGLSSIKAKEIMHSPVVTVDSDTPIAHVRSIMLDKGFSHLPIISDQKIVGIVTGEDIVTMFITSADKTTRGERSGQKVTRFPGQVNGIMNKHPVVIAPEASVLDSVKMINKMDEKYCLVVDEEQHLHGIITHRELLSVIHDLLPEPELPVYIVGIDNEDFIEKAVVEEKIRRTVERIMKMQEITEIRVRVKSQRSNGERTRYTLSARTMGPFISLHVESEDWGLMEAFDGLVDALDKTLRRAKKEPQKGSRRGRRRPNPHIKP
ncbi:CBS domain-containing protein [Thermoproteota archaeon]